MTGPSVHRLDLSGDAGLRAAQDIATALAQALAGHDRVAIATEAVTAADITTIQLLLAARRQAQASGKSLTLAAPPSGALRQLLVAVGCLDDQGRPLTPDGEFWTHTQEDRAA